MTVTIKFADEFVGPILRGEKNITIRYELEEVPNTGERFRLADESEDVFGSSRLQMAAELSPAAIAQATFDGHRNYSSADEVLDAMRQYYPDAILTTTSIFDVLRWVDVHPDYSYIAEHDDLDVDDFDTAARADGGELTHPPERVEVPLDDFAIRRTDETAGARFSEGKTRIILHNHLTPCYPATQLEDYVVEKLGAEVAPRPELKRFCNLCDFPEGVEEALMRTPKAFRREE